MRAHDGFRPYGMGENAGSLPVDIEGMTARFGGGVLIGLRNPIPKGKALVVSLQTHAHGQSPHHN